MLKLNLVWHKDRDMEPEEMCTVDIYKVQLSLIQVHINDVRVRIELTI